jgi:hypothetical protein
MLQTTIHLGDPQTTANFIEGAPASYFRRSYSLDAMSSEAFKRLRSSLFGQHAPSLYYNHTLLALDLYPSHSNTSEASYEYIRAATLRCFPDVKLPT